MQKEPAGGEIFFGLSEVVDGEENKSFVGELNEHFMAEQVKPSARFALDAQTALCSHVGVHWPGASKGGS